MPFKLVFFFVAICNIAFSQSIEMNSGVLKGISEKVDPKTTNELLYKSIDNFIDVRFLQKLEKKKHIYYGIGLFNRSDNFGINVHNEPNSLYPSSKIDYKNRVTTIYGALRWQHPIFHSGFWIANQFGVGINWYRIENKQYLHPQDNDYIQTGSGPYFLEVVHRSHLKLNLRYELMIGFQVNSRLSFNMNCSLQFPSESNYTITTNTSLYGGYFENFFQSEEYHTMRRTSFFQYQLGVGVQYKFSRNED